MKSNAVSRELQTIPGVGPCIAEDLISIGIRKVSDLKNKSPDRLYERLCAKQGTLIDRCLLYVLRGAVYYASNTKHEPQLLKWWNWKDLQ